MNVLIMGGSKFMGLRLIEKLIEQNNNIDNKHKIFIVNRGKVYWDNQFEKIIQDKDNIYYYKADRENTIQFKQCLQRIINDMKSMQNNKNSEFDSIIDFSCFDPQSVENLLSGIEYQFKKYIFISTDSTYNASDIALIRNDEYFLNNSGNINKVTEDLAVVSKNNRSLLKKRDDYGYYKLKAEIKLEEIFIDQELKSKGKYFYCLRLPDVIGQFDDTYRLWCCIEWIKKADEYPIQLEKVDIERPLSFVFREDVVDFSIFLINLQDKNILDKTACQSYNIACEESITIKELMEYIASYIQKDFKYSLLEDSNCFYPSVTIGPISIQKIKDLFNFKPTALIDSLRFSLDFCLNEGIKYKKEEQNMYKDFKDNFN